MGAVRLCPVPQRETPLSLVMLGPDPGIQRLCVDPRGEPEGDDGLKRVTG